MKGARVIDAGTEVECDAASDPFPGGSSASSSEVIKPMSSHRSKLTLDYAFLFLIGPRASPSPGLLDASWNRALPELCYDEDFLSGPSSVGLYDSTEARLSDLLSKPVPAPVVGRCDCPAL